MLVSYRFANFRCFREEQELSLLAGSPRDRPELVDLPGQGIHLLRVAGVYGGNASGKSTTLAALEFMRDAVGSSHQDWKPGEGVRLEPHAAGRQEASRFEATFLAEGVLYTYSFKLDREQVLEEKLEASPHGRRQLWFDRSAGRAEPFVFGKQLRGENRTIARLTRPNSLFLSAAAANNHPQLSPVYTWFTERLGFVGKDDRLASLIFGFEDGPDSPSKEQVLALVEKGDLGIHDYELREIELGAGAASALRVAASHPRPRELRFAHRSERGEFWLPFHRESQGTLAWFGLLRPVLRSLKTGGVLCVDELDASLHPHLVREVVRLFQDPSRNPGRAQLIFNTHDSSLLGNVPDAAPLHRDEVWLTEKNAAGEARLFPLSDFKP
ncbi:MAG TPA: ATP-binding protein, partial [Thermoanaerobaculia bacterium]|nr:ATP-binding protein [Thermoanaerobaculia bacterium]